MIVDRTNATEDEVHFFSVEASTIGLRPGEWPERLETTLGNRLPLIRRTKIVVEGDLQWVVYSQANGCIRLRVFND